MAGKLENKSSSLDIPLASLVYTRHNGKRQKVYMPPRRGSANEETYVVVQQLVKDARKVIPSPSIENHGFQLITHDSSLKNKDFYSNAKQQIEKVYYSEICEAVKKVFPDAAEVKAFHHTVRKAKDTSKNGSIELNLDHGNGEVKQPVGCVHCDYTVHNAIRLFDSMAIGANRKGRYAIINAWRNIATTPIQDNHLAVCDARSVIAPDDFVPFDIVTATEVSETYHLDPGQHNFHKWYYYPNMRKQEILLFMQYDSNPMTKTRYAFHTAVRSPHAAANSPPRESIECRCIAFFPDHTPNTIPSIIYKDNEIVSVAANEILESLKYPLHWPADARKWMASELCANGGVGRIIHELVNGGVKRKQYGLEKASKQQLDEIVKKLASASLFERTAKQNFPPK